MKKTKRFHIAKMEQGVRLLLQGMGIDLNNPNYKETPQRVSRLFAEMLSPVHSNWKTFPTSYRGLVLLRNHEVIGLCPHHLQPVPMRVHVAYLPKKTALGLSKLARAVEERLSMPVLQEQLTQDVADALEAHLEPLGVGVIITGRHGCMQYRGIRSEADVVTSSMRGAFFNDARAREELMMMIGRP
jgi:GTP cyclohydrolase I